LYWFLLAFGFRLFCYVGSDVATTLKAQLLGDHWENIEIAYGLLGGHGFAGVLPDHKELPSAWCPPGSVLVIAAMKAILGDDPTLMIPTVYVMNSAFDGLTTALVGRIGMGLGGRVVGVLAFLLHLVAPNLIRYGFWVWDTPMGDLAVVMLLERTVLRRDVPTLREDILAGAGLSLAGMFSGPALFVGPTIVLSRGFRAPRLGAALVSALVVCVSFLICQLPWVVRNALVLGAPILTRTTYPIAAHMANLPGESMLHAVVLNGNASKKESNLYAELGEVGFQRLCRERFWEDVRAYPRDYVIRCAYRLFQLWIGRSSASCAAGLVARAIGSENVQYEGLPLFPPSMIAERICEQYGVTVAVLALLGMFGMARIGKGREAVLLASVIVFATLVYAPCHVEDRFRSQFESVLSLLAAFGLTYLTGTYRWGVSRPYPRFVVEAGSALRRFFTPRPRSEATLPDALARSAVTALAASLILLYPVAVETAVLNKAWVGLNFLFDTWLWILTGVFFLDLFRRGLTSKP
jgi:hypothetical protein